MKAELGAQTSFEVAGAWTTRAPFGTLIPCHRAKGLELEAVLLVGCAKVQVPSDGLLRLTPFCLS